MLFLHADNDGYKLDANHDTPIEADDLPGLVAAYRDREAKSGRMGRRATRKAEWTAEVVVRRRRRRCAPTTSICRPGATGR